MKKQIVQGSLFQTLDDVKTQVISRREDFESLFDGFTKMRAITYVLTSHLLHEFFEKRGYEEIEVIVENTFKSYWENWWKSELDMPQLVLTSNEPKLQDWARSRVKRIDFDVHFAATEKGREKLKDLFEYKNNIFRWFSYLYLKHLVSGSEFRDDELYIARSVMRELYAYAGRKLPEFFLDQPVEKKYDLGKMRWTDLLYNRREAKLKREKERLLVRFPDQMQYWEIRRYVGYLPPEVKARVEGHTIIIETPKEFDTWCPAPRPRLWPFGRS